VSANALLTVDTNIVFLDFVVLALTFITLTIKNMKNELTTEEIALGIQEWCLERVRGPELNRDDARALVAEFYEWLEPQGSTIEIYSLNEC